MEEYLKNINIKDISSMNKEMDFMYYNLKKNGISDDDNPYKDIFHYNIKFNDGGFISFASAFGKDKLKYNVLSHTETPQIKKFEKYIFNNKLNNENFFDILLSEFKRKKSSTNLEDKSIEYLKKLIDKHVQTEEYEKAAKVKKIIDVKNKEQGLTEIRRVIKNILKENQEEQQDVYLDSKETKLAIGNKAIWSFKGHSEKVKILDFIDRPEIWGHKYNKIGKEAYIKGNNMRIYVSTKELTKI